MKKAKKKPLVKGMTLVECLVALCVFAIAATVMIRVGTLLNNYIRSANLTQEKLCIQSPRAQARLQDSTVESIGPRGLTLKFEIDGNNVDLSVKTDTYHASSSTDEARLKDGAVLNYMVFDFSLIAGNGLNP